MAGKSTARCRVREVHEPTEPMAARLDRGKFVLHRAVQDLDSIARPIRSWLQNGVLGDCSRVGKCLRTRSLHLDDERPTRAVEELHQIAATRTERRLFAQVDFRREMRPIAFVDPAASVSTSPTVARSLPACPYNARG